MVCFHGMRVSRLAERFSPEKGSRGVSSRDTPLLTFHGNRAAHFFQQGQFSSSVFSTRQPFQALTEAMA